MSAWQVVTVSGYWVCQGSRRLCNCHNERQAEQLAALCRRHGMSVQVRYIVPPLTYPSAEKGEGA